MSFQAAVTAIAIVALACGHRVRWLPDADDTPSEVWSETHGPGDDVRLRLRDGKVAEVQCKKGLSRSEQLWDALLALAEGVRSGTIDWGVLAVCPQTSGSIRTDLAMDLRRLADGRVDGLTSIGQEFLDRIKARGLDVPRVCGKLVIQVIAAIDSDGADIRAANVALATLLERPTDADPAWRALELDALMLIRRRGGRNAAAVAEVLRGAGLALADSGGPAVLASRLAAWTTSVNATFKIIGVGKALSTADSLLDVSCRLLEGDEKPGGDLKAALDRYHNPPSRVGGIESVDPTTLGRFYRHAVLLAGPGMGKSTLMKRLALEYAQDGYPVLRVSLREVAQRLRAGEPFLDAAFNCGLADSGLPPLELRRAFQDWVLLGDGLDECAEMQEKVAEGLNAFALAFPRGRVVATSRPIGYQPALLAAWRHYELAPFETSSASTQVAYLLADILADDDIRQSEVFEIAGRELSDAQAKKLGTRSPFLLSLAASLVARGDALSGSKADLYERLLTLIESEPPARAGQAVESRPVRRSVLGLLGWASSLDPLQGRDAAIRVVADILGPQLDAPPLKARDIADRCLEHWERLGVVETLRHGGAELVAFVHKTFGEHLAARHLAALPAVDRDREIGARLDDPSWNEVLAFSAAFGLTDALVMQALECESADPVARVRWALSLAAANPPLRGDLADRLVAQGLRLLDDPSRDVGIKVANPLVRFWGSRPGSGAPPAALRESPKVWVQLAAWCCAVSAGPGAYALAELEAFLRGLPELDLSGWRNKRGYFLSDLGDDREAKLAERLVVLAARELLQRSARATADEILAPIFAMKSFGSIDYLREVEGLFAELQHSYPLEAAKVGRTFDDMFPPDEREAGRAAFAKLASAFAVPDEDVPAEERTHVRPPLELDAFLKLAELDSPGREVWSWAKVEAGEALRHLLSNVLILTRLPEQAVRRQARVQMRKTEDETSRYAGFPYLPNIDFPPMEWAGARGLDLDAALLGEALHHPVNGVALLAARLIESGLPDENRIALGRDALERGRGLVAAYGALLLDDFDRPLTARLVLRRLEAFAGGGLRYLYQLLPNLPISDDASLDLALRNGLLEDHWTASEAAKAALHFAGEGRPILPALLAAWDHWRKIETEWTKGSRPSPSPREALLKAIQLLDGAETSWLVETVMERRTHIGGAVELLIARLRERPDDLRQTMARIRAGEVRTSLLRTILDARLGLTSSEIDWIEKFADNPDTDRREIAGVLARQGYLADARADALADKLIGDPEEHVRELGREVRGKLHNA
ncbi:MAG: hypothetical protein EPO51_16040 [Phenylobacterium sp.]|uniref:NACHT domain-containing protein n=1 Tax=Phenylobacterium sp. TaxID=1871053 RepID=UPI001208C468|nr:NACHT domain-containing protein [Phenylobacterium sp.]TAJ71017.1 MAG: hypothetical protein EPO51_16040 [Phenylobacterium sp.]